MLAVLGFLIILGPLVVFHELGHYLFARFFGVRAEIFSVGFGPRIWSKQIGETEWRVSAIPLGGYVKLLGEEPDKELSLEDQKRALNRQEPWKRFLIYFAGPLFNFILALLVFISILGIGEPQMASYIGRVVPGSLAAQSGFQSGDTILKVDGNPVSKFEEILHLVNDKPGHEMIFEVSREEDGKAVKIKAKPSDQDGYSIYGESTSVGEIDGLLPMSRATTVGVSDLNSAAGKLGVRTGDKVLDFNGRKVHHWEELERIYANTPDQSPISLSIETRDGIKSLNFKKEPKKLFGEEAGLYSSELFVEKAVPGSPAELSGIKSGDRLTGIGPAEVKSFFELRDAVQKSGEKDGKVVVRWEREGKKMTASIQPTATVLKDPLLKKSTQYTVGVIPQLVWAEPKTVIERISNPIVLIQKSFERLFELSKRNVVSIGKMFTGNVSIATLGGPILIGKIAGESLSRGLIAFLTTMSILSVGLGVLNLMPIPVLDGGQLLLLVIEAVRGKPLSVRTIEITQQVGLALILLLMVVVMRNDISRLPLFD